MKKGDASGQIPALMESFLMMGTVVSIRLVGGDSPGAMQQAIRRAEAAMRAVEETCSRFDSASALRDLCRRPGEWVPAPPILFHALSIAVEVANLTQGVFDPTVGRSLELSGFNRHYLTGEISDSQIPLDPRASYRDILLSEVDGIQKVRLQRPLLLDLGALAKGLAVDLGVQALGNWPGLSIDAGGDVFVAGMDPSGEAWRVGIEDPMKPDDLLGYLTLTDMAVCTSGSYKRRSSVGPAVHHLWDPVRGSSAVGLLSTTVVASQAVLADVAATAAFLLGPQKALPFIEELGLAGCLVTEDCRLEKTESLRGFQRA